MARRRFWRLTPGRIAAGYVLFGLAWIALSDRLVLALFETEAARLSAQTAKGWVFVGLSAIFIFWLARGQQRQLEWARDQATTASQQLQVLHRIFRHNVRNDMTVVQGFARVLRERNNGLPEEWLATVDETATSVIQTSEKLRIVGAVEEDPDSTVDLVAVLAEELDHFREEYPAVTVSAAMPDRLPVRGEWAIQYAVREALENAMAHHPDPPAERHVSIEVQTAGGNATVAIQDDGPGLPEAETEPIEAGAEEPLSHGSGVGLWLIAWLCRRHGGSVHFQGDNGTAVELVLPLADPVDRVASRLPEGVREVLTDGGEAGS